MSEAHLVVHESLFKSCLSPTYVCFRRSDVVRVHGRFINDTTSHALPIKDGMVRILTVAAPRLVIPLVFCPTYTGIMALNNSAHIRHATVADFGREYFM